MKVKQQVGFIALITVIVLGLLLILIVVGVSLRTYFQAQTVLDTQESTRALEAGTLCVEYAFQRLYINDGFTGDVFIVGDEACTIVDVSDGALSTKIIQVESTVAGHTRRIQVEVSDVGDTMKIEEWVEVERFQ